MSALPEARSRVLVTNTTPLIALTAATGSLDVLHVLYDRVVVPLEVAEEIRVGGQRDFGIEAFQTAAAWLDLQPRPVKLQPWLQNSLDKGEAAVIQTALDLQLPLVCIDETVGRRIAHPHASPLARQARQPPNPLMSRAPSSPLASQMKPGTSLPSASSVRPMPSGAGMAATKLPKAVAGSSQTSTSMATPPCATCCRPGRLPSGRAYRR
jgi:predicted nucleic acid-binding protein